VAAPGRASVGAVPPARGASLRLHLGCGSTVVPGWHNLDKSWNVYLAKVPPLRRALRRARILTDEQADAVFPEGIIRADLRRGIPYASGSAHYIYSSHMIEHLSRWQAVEVLGECVRVLKRGGVVRLATPDLGRLVGEYVRGERSHGATPADSLVQQLDTFRELRGSTPQRLVRRLVSAPHQWLYDAESLTALVLESGFRDPLVREFRTGELPDLEQLEFRPESLFLEARRP